MYIYVLISFLIAFSFSQHTEHDGHDHGPPKIGSVYGTVIDKSNNTPIEYASISIYRVKSEELVDGGITDSDGLFNINEIPPGNFMIVLEFIGYEKNTINDVVINREKGMKRNLGSIALQPKAIQSSEITITEDKPLIEFETDKLVYNASDDILSKTSGSAEDVLNEFAHLKAIKPESVEMPIPSLTPIEQSVYRELSHEEMLQDEIIRRSQQPAAYVSAALLQLEMKKLVTQHPGRLFTRAN